VEGSDNLARFQEQREASLDSGDDDGLGFGKGVSANGEQAGNCPGCGNSLQGFGANPFRTAAARGPFAHDTL
jgi:hypothetical protein